MGLQARHALVVFALCLLTLQGSCYGVSLQTKGEKNIGEKGEFYLNGDKKQDLLSTGAELDTAVSAGNDPTHGVTNKNGSTKKAKNQKGGRRITRVEVKRWFKCKVETTGNPGQGQWEVHVECKTTVRMSSAVIRTSYLAPGAAPKKWSGIVWEDLKDASQGEPFLQGSGIKISEGGNTQT
eukprot:TRINITY_DN1941_c0_g1_i1.p1 TRINITY_DN1941_c0_g1~~TRINITY_DN1941_c0_g1_i1.p1  ORF type:complete len:181 (+),score=19.04 TRINITY_DN1941_c0_g1_i1:65-607(+)